MTKFCNVLYFKHIIENAMNSFFWQHEKDFVYDSENNIHVFSSGMTRSALKKDLRTKMVDEILKLVSPYDPMERRFFFMVGSCSPNCNYLLNHIDKSRYFPHKISNYIKMGTIKYILKEEGVKIDLSMFNGIFEELFDEFFKRKGFKKYFPKNLNNLFFIKCNKLDCYLMYRIIKQHFGKKNVSNMHEDNKEKMKSNLYSVNNRIDDYVTGIKEILKNEDLKMTIGEIEDYLDGCIGNVV